MDQQKRSSHRAAGDSDTLPHALVTAKCLLSNALDEAIDLYDRTLRFPNPSPVIDGIERFVHELRLVPEWFAELERRAGLVRRACAEGSPYDKARRAALDSYTATPPDLCRGKLAIGRLRGANRGCPATLQVCRCSACANRGYHATFQVNGSDGEALSPEAMQDSEQVFRYPEFVIEITTVKEDIRAVLDEPSLGLTQDAHKAFAKWEKVCRKIQLEAQRLEVDGCWYLYHAFLAAEPQCPADSKTAKGIVESPMGGVFLGAIRAAAESMVAWIRESPSPDRPPAESRGGKPGRKPSPEIAKRNKAVLCMFADGKSVDDVCDRFGISANLARKIKSDAGQGADEAHNEAES
jgi:hypothetical protein